MKRYKPIFGTEQSIYCVCENDTRWARSKNKYTKEFEIRCQFCKKLCKDVNDKFKI